MLAYDLDGRYNRLASVKADVGEGRDTSGSGRVGDITIVGKTTEAITHWKLLGSSVRSPTFVKPTH